MQASLSHTEFAGTLRSPRGTHYPSPEHWSDVGIIEVLEQDQRPTFVVDLLDPGSFEPGPFQIIFANTALWSSHWLVRLIFGPASSESLQYKSWALRFVKDGKTTDSCSSSYMFGGITWSCCTVRRRFRFVSGNLAVTSPLVVLSDPALTAGSETFNFRPEPQVENSEKQGGGDFADLQRRQQLFIGITLHELQNAFDPISRSAVTISNVVSTYQSVEDPTRRSKIHDLTLQSCADAAQSITHWANYQKQIADDMLAISKFDLDYLRVTPVDMHPVQTIQRLLRMFKDIFRSNDIQHKLLVEDAYWDLGIDRVRADSQKLFQILINLITNAIERTRPRENRCIWVSINAVKGTLEAAEKVNVGQSSYQNAFTGNHGWGNEEEIYLHFTIQDTGQAIEENVTDMASQRFPHCLLGRQEHHSITDLRLFICAFLAELHGGQIRVEAESGGLSGFNISIKAVRLNS